MIPPEETNYHGGHPQEGAAESIVTHAQYFSFQVVLARPVNLEVYSRCRHAVIEFFRSDYTTPYIRRLSESEGQVVYDLIRLDVLLRQLGKGVERIKCFLTLRSFPYSRAKRTERDTCYGTDVGIANG